MDKTNRPLWNLLLIMDDMENTIQLTCDECIAILEYDANLLAAGVSIEKIRHSISHHLAHCTTCKIKYDKWLKDYEQR